MSSMASPLHIPTTCVSIKKKSYTWFMVPTSDGRGSSSMHSKVEPRLQRWLRGGDGLMKRGNCWRVRCEDWSCGIPPPHYPLSTLELIKNFYISINKKEHEQLATILAEDCCFEDLVFYIPFQGKQGVLQFLQQLTDAMGQKVQFVTESLAEGESYTASVTWHLAWNGHQIPFTNGCYFFQCEKYGEKLLIKHIRGVEELPVKPGDFVLKLLKTTSTFLDKFPGPAELLLKSDQKQEGLILTILHLFRNDRQGSP